VSVRRGSVDGMSKPAGAKLLLGRKGEDLAARYLESKGLVVLSRNWRCREGELDLVATDGRRLIVCEVKTRTSNDYGTPTEAVTDEKSDRIRRLARRWLTSYQVGWCELRFDIVSVLWPPGETPRIRHLTGAF
jgi:putative endonuclease